mgnify:CR=1 FL=1
MEINPTEYLKPRIVDVDIVNPQRAKVVLEPMIWIYIRKFY